VLGLETWQKILLKVRANVVSGLQCWRNLADKVNSKKIDLTPMGKKRGTNHPGLLIRAGSRPILVSKEEVKTFHHTV